ncbi:ribosome biogenesis GTPase Der [Paracholeplasma manati]|uniref:GTPase Der n=1 Tax=Paracholeplasma manati TaxID=591373 RepID=A0ABT2Y5L6_9MOLU|nr:ribosome biogenesis GTPase Der [Paracholeplasma manati]MCV2232042.1 ribosome biogenesis GTPase Der [Paracholeplasma manati]MDG0888804.1 ribosome biogenesis GTPase Der [Paracholeplasma manati]
MPFKVAIVGRPNVGKSSLFNRMIGSRLSITDDAPGVTRDRIYAKTEWLTKSFAVIDTGGIEISDAPFLEQIKQQADVAIQEADLIIFVVDSRSGLTDDDLFIAKRLYPTDKKVIVVVNKVDNVELKQSIYEFYALGFGDPIAVSANHGIGVGELMDQIIQSMPDDFADDEHENAVKIAVIGYPNVGKSSLTNAILGQERVIVSEIAGTTRDAIDTPFIKDDVEYVIIDTAGIRKRGQVYENTEKYSVLRALQAIERCDVALIVVDGTRDIIAQDMHVAGYIQDYAKASVVVVNKWDIVKKDEKTMGLMKQEMYDTFKFLAYTEVCFVSAKENKRIDTLFPAINKAYESYNCRIPTSVMNDVLLDSVAMNPPAQFNQGKAKFSYMTQVSTKPPTFVIFVNDPSYVHFSYLRYLENQFRKAFDFTGSPIKLILRKKEQE